MSWQRISERARREGMRTLQSTFARLRSPFGRSAGDLYLVQTSHAHHDDEAGWWSQTAPGAEDEEPSRDASTASPSTLDDVVRAVDHVSETIDQLAAQLAAQHDERGERLEAIEFLVREVLLGGAPGSRAVVLGGVVESAAIEPGDADITIIAESGRLEVDTPVEVRSRFHDRWICGFAIAESVETSAGPYRYRLTRRSDGIPLPILFEACDVRSAATFERQAVDQP
jgi:hypothetical protein